MTMWDSFFQAICRVGIFMICARAVIHFRPQEAYEKYLKLLVSVMVLVQLFLPLGGFLLSGGGQEAAEGLSRFGAELEESMRTATENAAKTDALIEQMTLEEIRRALEGQEEEAAQTGEGNEDKAEENGLNIEPIAPVEPIVIDLTGQQ